MEGLSPARTGRERCAPGHRQRGAASRAPGFAPRTDGPPSHGAEEALRLSFFLYFILFSFGERLLHAYTALSIVLNTLNVLTFVTIIITL